MLPRLCKNFFLIISFYKPFAIKLSSGGGSCTKSYRPLRMGDIFRPKPKFKQDKGHEFSGSLLVNYRILFSNRVPLTSELCSFWSIPIPYLRTDIYVTKILSLDGERLGFQVCPLTSAKVRLYICAAIVLPWATPAPATKVVSWTRHASDSIKPWVANLKWLWIHNFWTLLDF